MLIEFSVENFLSIKNKITLSMMASKDTSHPDNLISYEDHKKNVNLLKTSVIYGANASGKTNILKSMKFMSWFINNSHKMQQGKKISRIPFKLDSSCIYKPSTFEVIFIYKGIKYSYSFSVNGEKVIEEYLYYYPNGRQSTIFERWDTNNYKFTVDVDEQNMLKERNTDNKLYISTAALWNYDKVKAPFEWLSDNLVVIIENQNFQAYTGHLMNTDPKINELIKEYMKIADLGIDNIKVTEMSIDEALNGDFLNGISNKDKLELLSKVKDAEFVDIRTVHYGNDENQNHIEVQFEMDEESHGTQRLFGLLGPWIDVLKNGHTLVVDELDIRLHTILTQALVKLFLNPNINTKGAQLIFTTHDTNLLNQDILRRDQIWFAEKDNVKSTDFYSLDDFGIRKDERIEKGYLQGKYGAIPFIKGDWTWD